jgi:4-hydroxybenzoate polyprenyltransferase
MSANNPTANTHPFLERLHQYAILARMHKPIGTLLLLWPMLCALWIAGEGEPDPFIVLVFLMGTFLMRSAGCAINDFADRKIDRHVKRTADRPLATGAIEAHEALAVFCVLSIISLGLVLLLNWLTIALSVVGALLAASYPFMKRYTYLPQVYLGAAFGWAIPMAFAAQLGEVPRVGWLLFLAAVIWATIYDTMYAMVDRDDDINLGVRSTAILFGDADRFIIGVLQLLMFGDLLIIGDVANLGLAYHAGLAVAALFAVYHQYLIRERKREACFKAFLHNNWLGAALFAGVLVDYWLR